MGCWMTRARLRSDMAIEEDGLVQGLVIDDFFVVAMDPIDFIEGGGISSSVQCLRESKGDLQQGEHHGFR